MPPDEKTEPPPTQKMSACKPQRQRWLAPATSGWQQHLEISLLMNHLAVHKNSMYLRMKTGKKIVGVLNQIGGFITVPWVRLPTTRA
jgi:hypothetical protein